MFGLGCLIIGLEEGPRGPDARSLGLEVSGVIPRTLGDPTCGLGPPLTTIGCLYPTETFVGRGGRPLEPGTGRGCIGALTAGWNCS